MSHIQDLFTSDPDWASYMSEHGIKNPSAADLCNFADIQPVDFDPIASREDEIKAQQEWSDSHPLSSLGYESSNLSVQARDGVKIPVKISWPTARRAPARKPDETTLSDEALPVLFVTHGGGWIQGTHAGEEKWLLYPLLDTFDLVIISVEYRLAPEHKFPTWIDDAWDVLCHIIKTNQTTLIPEMDVTMNTQRLILAGSSVGACISAVLSQRCRDVGIAVHGVILNVPVLCDYQQFPIEEFRMLNENGSLSYEQCTTTVLGSGVMKTIWDLAIPQPIDEAIAAEVSPLSGNLKNLPVHLIFVAGQDPCRDEGLLYAKRLKDNDVTVDLCTYPGLPHTFGEIHELKGTQKFWADLRRLTRDTLNLGSLP